MQANRALISDFKALGEKGSKEANDALYPAVAAGDEAARKKMIEMNMSLVINKVEAYIAAFPSIVHLQDDLISEGFVGLTVAVNKMAEAGPRENANPTGLMSYWIMGHIGRVVDVEPGIGSASTRKRARRNDEPMPEKDEESSKVIYEARDDEGIDPRSMVELRDMILASCETDEDRAIVDLREKRYTDREIAAQLDLSYTATYMMRREIYRRFLEKSGLNGEV